MTTTDVIEIMKLLGEAGIPSMVICSAEDSVAQFHVVIDNKFYTTSSPTDVIWDFWHNKKVGG